MRRLIALGLLATVLWAAPDPAAARVFVVNDDGGWCWFEDERSLVVNGKLVVGTVASGHADPGRRGHIEVASLDLGTGQATRATLHRSEGRRWLDDHNSPALVVRGDGRLLALYSLHGSDEKIYYRVSTRAGDASSWEPEQVFVPSSTSRVTYSNLHRLAEENGGRGRIYDFFRGIHNSYKPSFAYSDDDGGSWVAGNVVIDVPSQFRHRPYVKYASDGQRAIHLAYTEGHPRDSDNSVYHVFYRAGRLYRSDGTEIRGLRDGLRSPEEGTRVFAGDAQNVAWVSDLHLDRAGRPHVVYSVQKDSGGKPPREHGHDHRYRWAFWDGSRWQDQEIAYAGTRLYAGEDDYTGNAALDPLDPATVYISTNADPASGRRLEHWELYRGRFPGAGRAWKWTPITENSAEDNLRPMVPIWNSPNERAVLWLRGKMHSYTDYRFAVMARIERR